MESINGRKIYSKRGAILGSSYLLYHLLYHQYFSYEYFLNKGIKKAFSENFPIVCDENNLVLDFVSLSFGEQNKNFLNCKEKNTTYDKALKVRFRLSLVDCEESIEDEILVCNIPLLTDSATFIINGSERTIITQIVRSPGFYLIDNGFDDNGNKIIQGDLIPNKGNYLQFESTEKTNKIFVKINRQKKIPLNIFFYALGLEYNDILSIFGKSEFLLNSLDDKNKNISHEEALYEFFSILYGGETQNKKNAMLLLNNLFFDNAKYNLDDVGRYKLLQRLSIYNLLDGKTLAEDLIDNNKKVIFNKGYTLNQDDINFLMKKKVFENGAHQVEIKNAISSKYNKVNIVKISYGNKIFNVIGTDLNLKQKCLTISDIVSSFSCFLNIFEDVGEYDDIDSLNNRRVRCVGELLENQIRSGISTMNKTIYQKMRFCKFQKLNEIDIKSLVNPKPIATSIHDFFATSQLSSFLDQTNPLSEITNKRRLSALGPGGIAKDRAVNEARDVHYTHYSRLCPVETPEGQSIGLVLALALCTKIDEYGFLTAPYRSVIHKDNKHIIVNDIHYLSVFDEKKHVICSANVNINENNEILDDFVVARYNGENIMARIDDVHFIDVFPKQIVSVASACIPFLESDDTTRALMGANMQRQAVPLLVTEEPFVGTGMEHVVAHDSGLAVIALEDGIVSYVDGTKIVVKNKSNKKKEYFLRRFERSNKGTCINQIPIVMVGDKVLKDQIIADGPAMKNGDLALGKNVTVAFMTWFGYNYEDAIIISDRLVKDDVFTSIYIEEYEVECRETKLGNEEITREVPGVSEEKKDLLDSDGIVKIGTEVKGGDILVGKVTPIATSMPTSIEKFFMTIFSEKSSDKKDSSLRVKHGNSGVVIKIQILSRKNKDVLPTGVIKIIKVYVAQKRKINEGDKMSGRHGNKGIVSRILPSEDMPFLPDGTPVDIMLNPLGVPSRMNIGQMFELHLGLACKILNLKIATPVFDGIDDNEISELIKKAHLSNDFKTILYDGMTGEPFDKKISVGIMYMIKLDHMVEDKCHARSVGPYTLVAQQPLGGKAQNGGQRFGEMEAWALESYGAAYALQEMFTVKSDDCDGRNKLYEAIIKQHLLPKPSFSEAFRVFIKELQALCLDVEMFDKNGMLVNLDINSNKTKTKEKENNNSSFINLYKKR